MQAESMETLQMPQTTARFVRYALRSETRFIVCNVVSWSAIASIVLIGNKVLTGGYGSPELIGVLLCMPVIAFFWAVTFWRYVLARDPRKTYDS